VVACIIYIRSIWDWRHKGT